MPHSSRPTKRECSAILLLLVFGLPGLATPMAAQWRVEAWLGDAWNAPSGVTFSQLGQPEIAANASWSTRPYQGAWIYAGRIARWSAGRAWAFEYMHHKMYLDNPPPDVAAFQITNGANFLLAERLWSRSGWEYGVGVGPVFAVPGSVVRGLTYNNAHGFFHSQYELAGPGLQLNVARRLRLLPFTYGSLSLKATAARLYVHIADGHAVTTDYALHLQYGVSLQTTSR